jgi:acetylornithine deacetylase/succinyl-diaminopimelate desuccinylase-like protein
MTSEDDDDAAAAAARQALQDAERICAMPAPPFGEGPRAALVVEMLADAGAAATIDAAGNVIARLGPDDGDPPVVFAAHLDTVFAAGTPIAFTRGGDRLAAPGIGDNSLGVAGLLHLARHLRDRARAPRTPIALVATVGEEGLGDLRGAKALLDTQPCHAFIAVEGMMADTITVAAVGSLRYRVTVSGPGGHSWSDRGTPSAVHGLVGALHAALAEAAAHDGLAFSIGTIRGGTIVNAIADQASAELDLRAEDDALLRQAGDAITAALTATATDGLTTTIDVIGDRPGGRLAAGHPLLALARHARERAGLPPAEEGPASTDANAAYGRGIPAICVGITTGGNAHRLDEYIDLPPIAGGLSALALLADEIGG